MKQAAPRDLSAETDTAALLDIEVWLQQVAAVGLEAETIAEAMVEDGMPKARADALAAAAVIRHGPMRLQDLLSDERGLDAAELLYRSSGEAMIPTATTATAVSALLNPATLTLNRIELPDRSIDVLLTGQRPPMALFGKLLSDAECDLLVGLARDRLRPDTVVDNDSEGGDSVLSTEVRNSYGCAIHDHEHTWLPVLQARLTALLGGHRRQRETLVLSRYLPGQKFLPHHDYFSTDRAGYGQLVQKQGQRVATLVIYLSEVAGGGGTLFPQLGIEVRPQRGSATYFTYQRGDGSPDPASRHAGATVFAGEKWIATIWIRERMAS